MRQMTRTLRRFAERLDRDYDSVLLFLIVVEDGFRAIFHLAPSMVAGQDFSQLYLDVASEGLSLLQIGESSGIARETVRRKIKQLIDLDYLALNPRNKNVYLPYSTIMNPVFDRRCGAIHPLRPILYRAARLNAEGAEAPSMMRLALRS
jgi:hypothetical protein